MPCRHRRTAGGCSFLVAVVLLHDVLLRLERGDPSRTQHPQPDAHDRDCPYAVDEASGGRAALDIVEREGPFDVFVIDVVMPDMRGDELARRLRERDPDVKVLYFTGHSERLFKERCPFCAEEIQAGIPTTRPGRPVRLSAPQGEQQRPRASRRCVTCARRHGEPTRSVPLAEMVRRALEDLQWTPGLIGLRLDLTKGFDDVGRSVLLEGSHFRRSSTPSFPETVPASNARREWRGR